MSTIKSRRHNDPSKVENSAYKPFYAKKRRLTRSTFGSTVEIPIVLDSSSSDAELGSDELEKLEHVLANGRILAAAKRNSQKLPKISSVDQFEKQVNGNERKSRKFQNENVISQTHRKQQKTTIKEIHGIMDSDVKAASNVESKSEATHVFGSKGQGTAEDGTQIKSSGSKILEAGPSTAVKNKKKIVFFGNKLNRSVSPITSLNSQSPASNLNPKPLLKPALKTSLSRSNPHSVTKITKKVKISTTTTATISSSVSTPIKRLKISAPGSSKINPIANFSHSKDTLNRGAMEKVRNNVTEKFDPKNQKSYKDTYSVCCISCNKNNRSEYCNKQKPCDICVGKKLKNCSYPSNTTVAIPAVKKTLNAHKSKLHALLDEVARNNSLRAKKNDEKENSNQRRGRSGPDGISTGISHSALRDGKLQSIGNSGGSGLKSTSKIIPSASPDSESSESCMEDPRSRKRLGTLDLKNLKENTHPSRQRNSLAVSTISGDKIEVSEEKGKEEPKASRNGKIMYSPGDNEREFHTASKIDGVDGIEDSEDNSSDTSGFSDDSNEYENDEDLDIENDDGEYDDYSDDAGSDKMLETTRSSKRTVRSSTPQDNFTRAQRILKDLEFEKRDIDDIYVPNTRRKRTATKENYYIPSDLEDEANNVEGNGYAAAEARNEQLILSEDEQERRILRGEIGLDYIKSLRTEKEKHNYYSSDSLSSSDFD